MVRPPPPEIGPVAVLDRPPDLVRAAGRRSRTGARSPRQGPPRHPHSGGARSSGCGQGRSAGGHAPRANAGSARRRWSSTISAWRAQRKRDGAPGTRRRLAGTAPAGSGPARCWAATSPPAQAWRDPSRASSRLTVFPRWRLTRAASAPSDRKPARSRSVPARHAPWREGRRSADAGLRPRARRSLQRR
jgi:hypothetical protein